MVDDARDMDPVYSIIVPVYRSAELVRPLYTRLVATMEAVGAPFELIFVEDCGGDHSFQVLREVAEADPRVVAIQLMRNYGQANATLCGVKHARGAWIVTLDDDLQNPPEEIPKLIAAVTADPELDAVLAVPEKKQHAGWRRIGSWGLQKLHNWMFHTADLRMSSFRLIRARVARYLLHYDTPHPAIGPLLVTLTPRIVNVLVDHHPRASGRSGYTLGKLYALTLSRILSFSTAPLRALALIGVVGIFASIGTGLYLLYRALVAGLPVPGWTSLMVLLVIISSFNFFAFGLVGEYLLRILQTAQRTPRDLVRHRIGGREPSEP